MRQVFLSIFSLLVLTAPITSSITAFRSMARMKKSPYEVLLNKIVRNKDPNEQTKDCEYFQEWRARYELKHDRPSIASHNQDHQESHYIYYHVFRCLNKKMKVIRTDATFGPTEDPKDAHPLPEGCVTPEIEEPEENPCTSGFELGEDLVEQISTLVSKKILHNPEKVEVVEEFDGIIDPKNLDVLKKKLPDLEKLLEETLEKEHVLNPDDLQPDEWHTEEDGTRVGVYRFPDDKYGEKVMFEDGRVLISIVNPDGSRIDREETPGQPTEVVFSDPEGYITERQVIRELRREPDMEKVITYDAHDNQIGKPYKRPKATVHRPIDIEIPEHVQEDFDEAANNFADTLEKYVGDRVKCFAENIIDVKKNYLTFVCAETGHKSIRDALKHRFGTNEICRKHIDCKDIENQLIDQMLMAHNSGASTEDVKVTTDFSHSTTLEAQETSAS